MTYRLIIVHRDGVKVTSELEIAAEPKTLAAANKIFAKLDAKYNCWVAAGRPEEEGLHTKFDGAQLTAIDLVEDDVWLWIEEHHWEMI